MATTRSISISIHDVVDHIDSNNNNSASAATISDDDEDDDDEEDGPDDDQGAGGDGDSPDGETAGPANNGQNDEDGDRNRPSLSLNISPTEGAVYSSWEELRNAVQSWAMRDKFVPRVDKKDSVRAIYKCRQAETTGCLWRVRANTRREPPFGVVVSTVVPRHSCGGGTAFLHGPEKPKYAKRGAQFSQRWVRDSLGRVGFPISVETTAEDIVRCIQQNYGEGVDLRLAEKTRMNILVSTGEVPARERGKPGRPSKEAIAERQREFEAAVERRKQQLREARELGRPVEGLNHVETELVESQEQAAEERPFVFESGARVIGPLATTRNLPTTRNQGPPPSGRATAPAPPMSYNPTAMPETPSPSSFTGDVPSLVEPTSSPGPPPLETRLCQNCSGSGYVQVPQGISQAQHFGNIASGIPVPENAPMARDEDDELSLLKKQVELISKHISAMQRKRAWSHISGT